MNISLLAPRALLRSAFAWRAVSGGQYALAAVTHAAFVTCSNLSQRVTQLSAESGACLTANRRQTRTLDKCIHVAPFAKVTQKATQTPQKGGVQLVTSFGSPWRRF